MNSPCKNCPERRKLCHSDCDKYAVFVAEKERIRANRMKENAEFDFIIESRKRVTSVWYHGRRVKERKGGFSE